MSILAVFLPLLAAIIAGLFGRGSAIAARSSSPAARCASAALLSILIFHDVARRAQARSSTSSPGSTPATCRCHWALRLDTLSAVMLLVVSIVSALVHIYSIGYMSHDKSIPRFMAYLSLFTFFMLMLVTADNFVQMFFGWEGRRPLLVSADRLLVRPADRQRGGDQGFRRQPRRRFRLRARHLLGLSDLRHAAISRPSSPGAGDVAKQTMQLPRPGSSTR